MAEGLDFLNPIMNITSNSVYTQWINLGLTFLISTLVTGLLGCIIIYTFSSKWGESVKVQNAFLLVLVVNIINIFGLLGILMTVLPGLGILILILPLIIWIVLTKAFFSSFTWLHAGIAGLVAYLISIFLSPYLTGILRAFIPV